MENIESNVQRATAANSIPYLEKEHGYYGSASVTADSREVYELCRNEMNLRKVLEDLPEGVKNFLELKLEVSEEMGPSEFRLEWTNKPESKASGRLIFLVKPAMYRSGSIITAEAVFDSVKFREDGPSTLMNVFLKRMKALIETGVIATTKGQPSGREEISSSTHQTLQ